MTHEHVATKKVAEKWGFGMARPKPNTQEKRNTACKMVMKILSNPGASTNSDEILQSISEVKGLFNRTLREDQWDWFTVSGQLGYPSRRISGVISQELTLLRKAIKLQDSMSYDSALSALRRLPTRRCMSVFLGHAKLANEPGAGWIYVLSTRELSDLLKIGMTARTVEQRAREISNATGVAIPFGVRRCWRVSDPATAEQKVHQALREYRLRDDREFFRVSFPVAAKTIEGEIRRNGLEIRTLDQLSTVPDIGRKSI